MINFFASPTSFITINYFWNKWLYLFKFSLFFCLIVNFECSLGAFALFLYLIQDTTNIQYTHIFNIPSILKIASDTRKRINLPWLFNYCFSFIWLTAMRRSCEYYIRFIVFAATVFPRLNNSFIELKYFPYLVQRKRCTFIYWNFKSKFWIVACHN